jgi:hypothetical protein
VPPVPAAGVPASVPVPSALSVNVIPLGRLTPPRAIDGFGKPLVVTVNEPSVPTVKVFDAALVIAGASLMVKVKLCAGEDPAVFVAVKVMAYVPPVPAAGVPANVPVPLPLSVKVTPVGSATPPRAMVGVGDPLVVTVNVPAVPTVNVVALALVIAGPWFTVRVKFCAGVEPTVLVAVNVIA